MVFKVVGIFFVCVWVFFVDVVFMEYDLESNRDIFIKKYVFC